MANQKVRFTPLGTLVSLILILGLIGFGYYLITGKSGGLGGLLGRQEAQREVAAEKEREAPAPARQTEASQGSQSVARGTTAVLAHVRESGVLRVGLEPEAPPMNFVVGGKRDGFDYQMAQQIAVRIGAERVEVVEADYDELPNLLRAGEIDIMMGGYVPDPGLAKIEWSNGYLDFGLCLITKQGSAIKELRHLNGRTIGIYTDPAAREWIEANVPGVTIREYDGTGWFSHLDRGDVEAIIYDYPFAVEEIKQFPRLQIVKLNLNASSYSVGIPAGNTDLLDAVNAAIKQTIEAAGFDMMVKRFFKTQQLQVQALPQGAKTYTVKAGDTLSRIAEAQLGSASAWPKLWELNKERVPNPHLIEVGFQLQMP